MVVRNEVVQSKPSAKCLGIMVDRIQRSGSKSANKIARRVAPLGNRWKILALPDILRGRIILSVVKSVFSMGLKGRQTDSFRK